MMKQAANCACVSHAVPMAALTVMCWCGDMILGISISPDSRPDFGNFPDQTQPNPINQDWAWSGANFGHAPNFGDDILRSENWHFPQKKCWKCQIPILWGVSQWYRKVAK
jgi:hypothetical protein